MEDEKTVIYDVEVRDDHDGGSVWYSGIDDGSGELEETLEDAMEVAAKVSVDRKPLNGSARVVKITREVVAEFKSGEKVEDDE